MQSLKARSIWVGARPSAPQGLVRSRPCGVRPATSCVKAGAGASAQGSGQELQRRQILALPSLLLPLLWGSAARAEVEAPPSSPAASREAYVDNVDKFSIVIPSGWEQGSGDLSAPKDRFSNAAGMRRVVAWYPTGQDHEVTVAVTMQPIGPDFTGLGSFGRAEDFGAGLVNSMDRSYLLRATAFTRARNTEPIVIAKLLEAKEKDSMYYVSYSVCRLAPDGETEEEKRTVYSVVAMGNNGSQNRLFTVNASSKEPGLAAYGAELQAAVASFRPPAPRV